jgi:hypothetical protein
MSVTVSQSSAEQFVRNENHTKDVAGFILPWNHTSSCHRSNLDFSAGSDGHRSNLNGAGSKAVYIEIHSPVLRFLDIKPVNEEGFYWYLVHKTSDSVVWHRYPEKGECLPF